MKRMPTLRKLLSVGALTAVLVSMVAITLYVRTVNELDGDDQACQLMGRLDDATEVNYLLHRFNHGRTIKFVAILKSRLASDVKAVAWLSKASKSDYLAYASRSMSGIVQDQKGHSERYQLASTNAVSQTGTNSDRAVNLRHE